MRAMEEKINIKHLAKLAYLKLTKKEKAKFKPQLREIFEMFAKLGELDTSDVLPTFQTIPLKNIVRRDKVGDSFPPEEALKNTKQKQAGYFKTKPVFLRE